MQIPLQSVAWIHGAANCATTTDPLIQVHQFDQQTFIMRIGKCFSFEGNFLYLLFGQQKVILFDTGGPPDPVNQTVILPIRATVDGIIAQWLRASGVDAIELVVAHTHRSGSAAFFYGSCGRCRCRCDQKTGGVPTAQETCRALPDAKNNRSCHLGRAEFVDESHRGREQESSPCRYDPLTWCFKLRSRAPVIP